MEHLKKLIEEKIEQCYEDCKEISRYLFENPEVGGKEYKSAAYIGKVLEDYGFKVSFPYKDLTREELDEIGMPPGETLETALVAEYGGRPAGAGSGTGSQAVSPAGADCDAVSLASSAAGSAEGAAAGEGAAGGVKTVAFLAEYDALPGFGADGGAGHACGHNWIGAAMAGCGIVLSALAEELNMRVMVIGTPAEETYGAKVNMAKLGVFDEVDYIFQAHLSDKFSMEVPTLAMYSVEFDFHGKAAHAAINPENGINALEAVISMFNSINGLRQHVGKDAIIHGIITNGGATSNVIPEFAQCQFEIREKTRAKLDILRKRVIDTAKAAALATGTTVEYRDYENHNDELANLKTMTAVCSKYFVEEGIEGFVPAEEYKGAGSTDLGNVSYLCPTVYAEVKLADGQGVAVHDKGALGLVDSEGAHEMMKTIMKVFPLAAAEILSDTELQAAVEAEFRGRIG